MCVRAGADPGFGQNLLRSKVTDIVKWSHMSEVSCLESVSKALKSDLEAFGFLMLKYEISNILETLFCHF